MFRKHKTEVLVAGAGPVGLFTALSLAEQGVGVEIVEGQWRTTSRSYALALHPGSLALFADIGLADEILDFGHHVEKLAFYDGTERRGEVCFSRLERKAPVVIVLPQQALEDMLVRRLAERGVSVKWSHRLARLGTDGKKATARIERLAKESTGYSVSSTGWVVDKVLETEARFVVGADGHNSAVRRALDIGFAEVGDALFFGVFEFAADAAAPREVRVVLDSESTNVLWPLEDSRFRWSFQLDDSWEFVPNTRKKSRLAVQLGDDTFPYLDEEKLRKLVARRAPWFDADLGDIRWSVGVRFERRLAERFGSGNVWLVGDAAHLASPVGVQSMNVGFLEAHDLARRLAAVLRQGEDPAVFEAYGKERIAEWTRLLEVENSLAVQESAAPWFKKNYLRIPPTIPASGEDLRLLLRQVGIELSP